MDSPSSSAIRRPCFVEDDGLASIAGISGFNLHKNLPFLAQKTGVAPPLMVRRNSLRNIGSISSMVLSRSGRFLDPRFVEETHSPHFLEACFLCRKPLGLKNDIFMYRGDTPFCSEECRQEQIDIDEASEKKRNLKSYRKIKDSSKSASNSTSSSSPSKNYSVRTGAVAAA